SCTNVRDEAELVINKISEDNEPSGITFDLYYRGNSAAFEETSAPRYHVGSYVTADDGTIKVEDLPYGWYEIEEQTPAFFVCSYEGGQTSEGNKLVHLTSSSPDCYEEVTAVNSIRAQITVNKTDGWTGSSVGGTSFDLYRDLNGNGVLDEDESYDLIRLTDDDGDGQIVFDNVEAGCYIVAEAETVDGYYINEAMFPITVSRGQEYEVNVEDTPYSAFLKIVKTDEDDEEHYLTGAAFEIYGDTNGSGVFEEGEDLTACSFDGNTMAEVSIEEGSGYYVTTEPLRAGTYFIVETVAPEGFSVTEEYVTVVIDRPDTMAPGFSAEDIVVGITNRCRGAIHITKTDELYPDNKLTGAVFTVFDEDWNIMGTMTEEETGEYYLRDLPWGDYFVEETVSPEGFVGSDVIYEASIRYDGQVVDITDEGFDSVTNTCYGDITLYKVDEADHQTALPGAVFDVWIDCDGDGQLGGNDIFYSSMEDYNGDGIYTMTFIPRQRYLLCEVRAPEGYERDPNLYPFEITTDVLSVVIDNKGYGELDTGDGLFVNGRSIVTTTLSENGEKTIDPEEEVTISDNVFYKGLIPGLEYELTGTLIDKKTQEEITTTTMTFTPDEASGMVKICFTFNAADLAGEDIVCFEYMYRDGHEVGFHADIEAAGQTVTVGTPEKTDIPATGEKTNIVLRAFGAGASALSLMLGLIWFAQYKRKE
ncbi:MAG: VaFE repeat-containing surface-anchored protein, partial [Clostridiales bacterium]|nr:VaFE repeat-containing surface-anchored protein [Clostridiales bacterium]